MTETRYKSMLKSMSINILMLFIFILLLGFAIWITWMYFFRGPIPLETRGYVAETLKEEVVQPTDIEKYTLQHFHNLDEVVLRGIEYPSTCVTCHGDYPHNKTPKVRAFFNAHSWFMACETCHYDNNGNKNTIYRWLDSDTDVALYKLPSEPSMYAARIVPFRIENNKENRLDNIISEDAITAYNISKDTLNETQEKAAMEEMHRVLTKEPVSCDQCHTRDSRLNFDDLLYSENMATHLRTIDVGTMIKGYEIFHIPNVLDRQAVHHQ